MARVTDAEVEEIIEYDSSISLTPFINIANQLVTELCADSDYSDDRLLEIERWLSAHFYTVRDQRAASEKAGSVAISYQYKIGMLLQNTRYGQQALILDTAGNLAQLNKRMEDGEGSSITFLWNGEDYDSEDDDS